MYKRNKNTGNDADDNVKRDRIKLKLDYLKFCNQMTCDDASVSKALTDHINNYKHKSLKQFEKMKKEEIKILKAIGIGDPYIY